MKKWIILIGLIAIMIVSIVITGFSKIPTLQNALYVPCFIAGLIVVLYAICIISFFYPKLKWTIQGQKMISLIPLIVLVLIIMYDYFMIFSIKISLDKIINFWNLFISSFNFAGLICVIQGAIKLKQHIQSHGRIPIYNSIVLLVIAYILLILSTLLVVSQ